MLGLLVVEATESLASPVSWSHHFIWVVLLVAWLALAEDRPRYGEWYALGVAVLFWAAPYLVGAARAGRPLRRAGLADPAVRLPTCWSSSCVVVGAGVRVVRCARSIAPALRIGRRTMAPVAAPAA